MSGTEHQVARDQARELEARLQTLARTIRENSVAGGSRSALERARAEYRRLHPKWTAVKDQLRMDV